MSQTGPNPAKTANAQVNPKPALGWDVFVTPGIPIVTIDLPPGITQAYFQAMASTLIYGAGDAVLVDAFMTVKQASAHDNPKIIEETRQYIRDFDRPAEKTRTAQELYDKMLDLHPNRVNPGWALWSSARAVKPLSQTAENAK